MRRSFFMSFGSHELVLFVATRIIFGESNGFSNGNECFVIKKICLVSGFVVWVVVDLEPRAKLSAYFYFLGSKPWVAMVLD